MADVTARQVTIGDVALTVRLLEPADAAAVLALHRTVFGAGADARWFEWKYGEGQGRGAGAWHGERLIAFTGGLPRTLWHQGRLLRGMQMGDVMVHPDWRGVLTRRGPFYQVTRFLHSTQLGAVGTAEFQVGFGFPNARAARLGVSLGLMLDKGTIEALNWSGGATALPRYWRWTELDHHNREFDRAAERGWDAMRGSCRAVTMGQRDAAYLRWRYVQRPAGADETSPRYRFFVLRRAWPLGSLGVAVMDLRSATPQWLDWVGPMDWMAVACRACWLQAGLAGAQGLTAWASPAVAQALADTGIHSRSPTAGLGVSAFSAPAFNDGADPRWWLMGGDTDFL